MKKSDTKSLKHIGFILDGNRRWALAHGMPKLEGHRRGYENLKTIAEACFDRGIGCVSAYIFSTENWNREAKEVKYLMNLALKIFKDDLTEMHEKGIKIVFSGLRSKLSRRLLKAMDETAELTKNNKKGVLNLCFNYGGQVEIAEAVKKIIDKKIPENEITPEVVRDNLFHPEMPPVDMIVRTSGEQRLSNFLLWDSAYAELSFVTMHWPDFDTVALDDVISDFNNRNRRFGGQ